MKTLTIKPTSGASVNTDSPKQQQQQLLPITFRLPRTGERDPIFGISRSWYYAAEADGRINLIRLREKGKKRGTTLVPTEQVLRLIANSDIALAL